jgi:hypothetical protein
MDVNKLVRTPFMTNCKLSKDMGFQNDVNLKVVQAIPFQNVIGSFMYAMVCTRLDIAQVVGVVNHFMANPGQSHWIVMKWIFHYLKGIVDLGLCYKRNIKDVIMGKVHFDENVHHSQGSKKNMRG